MFETDILSADCILTSLERLNRVKHPKERSRIAVSIKLRIFSAKIIITRATGRCAAKEVSARIMVTP